MQDLDELSSFLPTVGGRKVLLICVYSVKKWKISLLFVVKVTVYQITNTVRHYLMTWLEHAKGWQLIYMQFCDMFSVHGFCGLKSVQHEEDILKLLKNDHGMIKT